MLVDVGLVGIWRERSAKPIMMAGKLRAEVRNAQVIEFFEEIRQQKKVAGLIFGDYIRFAAATPSTAFDGRVDALRGKPRAMGLPVGMMLGRIVDTEGHNFTARWLLALAAIYDGATRTEAAKLGGTILSGHAAKQTARRRTAKSKSSSRIRVLTMVERTKWSSRPER